MDKIVSISLPVDVALEYIQDVFHDAGASGKGSEDYTLAPENIFALAPESVDSSQLLDFLHGGVLEPMPKVFDGRTLVQCVPSTVEIAAKIVCEQLTLSEQPALWLHEALLTQEELGARNLPHVSVDGAIYLVFTGSFDSSRVAELIRYSQQSWHFLAFVVDGTNTPAPSLNLFVPPSLS
ncbi:hypothetical protein ACFOLJ_02570 [Rugamonas sp. CCM 8940]|uniref:hypothetical protein n=1 Tax=Rugamonas sp. CCM 8940 TaxID=2765359 RepID=UPI00361AACDD